MQRTPPVGHGGHVITAGAVTVPTRPGSPTGRPTTLSMSIADEQLNAGKELYRRILEAIGKGPEDDGAVRLLGLLVKQFPQATLRVPEFHEYVQHLHKEGRRQALCRIFNEQRRGRKQEAVFEGFTVVALVDMVMQESGGNISKAATEVQRYLGQMNPPRSKSVAAIRNDYARYKDLYDIKRGHFIPGEMLTDRKLQRGRP